MINVIMHGCNGHMGRVVTELARAHCGIPADAS